MYEVVSSTAAIATTFFIACVKELTSGLLGSLQDGPAHLTSLTAGRWTNPVAPSVAGPR